MPLRFTLRQLEYFVAVCECGSVAQAARRINVSAPSISTAIGQLEAEFGLSLFRRRHAHALTPTPAGRQILEQTRRLLAEAQALGAAAQDLGGEISGPLGIGCLKTFAALVLPDLRRGFEAAHPAAHLRQYEMDHADLLDALATGRIDIAMSYDLEVPPELRFEPLVDLPPWVILPPGHPLAGRPELHPEDLAGAAMVLLDLPHSNAYFMTLFERLAMPPRIVERTDDMAVLRALVANGYGFSLVNTHTELARAPDGKPLVFVRLRGGPRPLRLGILTMAAGAPRRLAAAFTEHCRQVIARDGLPGCARD